MPRSERVVTAAPDWNKIQAEYPEVDLAHIRAAVILVGLELPTCSAEEIMGLICGMPEDVQAYNGPTPLDTANAWLRAIRGKPSKMHGA